MALFDRFMPPPRPHGAVPRGKPRFGTGRRLAGRPADEGTATETSVFALALEPRYMLDAAAVATGAEAADQTADQSQNDGDTSETGSADRDENPPQQAEDPQMDAAFAAYQPPSDEPAQNQDRQDQGQQDQYRDDPATATGTDNARTEIIFVDGSVAGHEVLLGSLPDNAEIVVLDDASDALNQIAQTLEGRADVDAIHIVSHGAVGALHFGSGTVDAAGLGTRAADLAAIGAALTADGDILLYGCYVGADGAGRAFLDALAGATGADIAASEDLTGTDTLGGDWVLEAATGAIGDTSIDDTFTASSFDGTLAPTGPTVGTTTFGTSFVELVNVSDQQSASGNISGFTVTQTNNNANSLINIATFDFIPDIAPGGDYALAFITSGKQIESVSFKADDGSSINFDSMQFAWTQLEADEGNVSTITFRGLDSGSNTVGLKTVDIAAGFGTLSQTLIDFDNSVIGNFDAVSELRIEMASGQRAVEVYVDDIVTAAVAANAAPELGGAPNDTTATEDVATAIDLSAYNVSDADNDDPITLTLAVDRGTMASVDGNGLSGSVTIAGSGTGSMTLQGSASALNAYLNDTSKITFTTATDDTTSATLTVTPNDGTVDGTADTVAITITPVNDAPTVAGLVSDISFVEDVASNVDLSAATFADVDSASITVTLTASEGTFSTPADGAGIGVAETLVNGTTITLVGSAANINTYLDIAGNIQWTSAPNDNGQDASTFTVTANDGDGSGDVVLGTINADITAMNDAPAFANLDGTPAFTEGGQAVVLDGNVTISDLELDALNSGNGDYAGASLTIARSGGAQADDSFGFNFTGAPFTQFNNFLQLGGIDFATVSNTGGTLTITFDSTGVTADRLLVNEVLQRITYENTGDAPPASVTLDWSFSDGNSANAQGGGGAGTGTGSVTVSITGVDDAPTLAATGANPTFTEGSTAADLFSGVTANTIEAGQTFTSLTLTVTNVSDGADEILRFDGSDIQLTNGFTAASTATNGLAVSVSVTGGTATVGFTGASLSAAELQTLIDGLTYQNNSDNPTSTANRVVTITGLTDSGSNSGDNANAATLNLTSTVTVTPVNDPPVIGGVAGGTSGVTAGGGAQTVDLFDDATVGNADSTDYAGGFLTINQSTGTTNGSWGLDGINATSGDDGTIAAGEIISVGGVAIGMVSATNDGQGGTALRIDFNADATSQRVQALMRALTYDAPSDLGARDFNLTIDDGDGAANGGDADATAAFTVDVTPNPPVVSGLDGDSVTTASGVAVAIDQGGNVTVSDADSANFNGGTLTVSRTSVLGGSFSLDDGTVTAGGDGLLAASETVSVGGTVIGTITTAGQGIDNLVIALNASATPDRVTALIKALQYTSTEAGAHTFGLQIADAASGADPATSTQVDFTVTVNAPPVNDVPNGLTVREGQSVTLTGLTVSDTDSASITTTVSVASGNGTFTATTGTATITGAGTNSIEISGSLADVNATLAALQYKAAAGVPDPTTVTVVTSDDVGDSDTDSFDIAVTPNTAPQITTNTGLEVTAGESVTLTTDLLSAADADDDAVAYQLTVAPGAGSLQLDGADLAVGDVFTAADVAAGRVIFIVPATASQDTDSLQITPTDGTTEGKPATIGVDITLSVDVVIVESDGGGEVLLVETPVGPTVLATTPLSVSGDSLADIFTSSSESNSQIARTFFDAVGANNVTPIALAFQAAMNDFGVRTLLSNAVGEGRAIYVFDGSNWQLLDLSLLSDPVDQAEPTESSLETGRTMAPNGFDLAGQADVLGADQLVELLPSNSQQGAESFERQVVLAASSFEREAVQLATALIASSPPRATHGA